MAQVAYNHLIWLCIHHDLLVFRPFPEALRDWMKFAEIRQALQFLLLLRPPAAQKAGCTKFHSCDYADETTAWCKAAHC